MKRDMELVRSLLMDVSEGKSKMELDGSDDEDNKYLYHLKIMRQAGLIEYTVKSYYEGSFIENKPELTWQGNDFLDSIKYDNVWNKTKTVIKEKGAEISSIPFSILVELVKEQFKSTFVL